MSYFYNKYAELFRNWTLTNVPDVIAEYPNYKFVFTGHSLGAALTLHAAMDLMLSSIVAPSKTILYTYGEPRIANLAFMNNLSNMLGEAYRVVNNRDIVAHIPPCWKENLFTEGCVTSGFLPFYYVHTIPEVWYTDDFSQR